MIEHPLELDFWPGQSVLGIDEAGRGPIAGPLVVAGVIFPAGYASEYIDDSKKLSEKKREALFEIIKKDALWYQIEIVDEPVIDKYNIYHATRRAMEKIAAGARADVVLTDAMKLQTDVNWKAIIKGDQKSLSIAAASILAKVTRDRIMLELDEKYPQYGFKKHKGYPTKAHLEALHKYGLQDCYRHSYRPVQEMEAIRLFDPDELKTEDK